MDALRNDIVRTLGMPLDTPDVQINRLNGHIIVKVCVGPDINGHMTVLLTITHRAGGRPKSRTSSSSGSSKSYASELLIKNSEELTPEQRRKPLPWDNSNDRQEQQLLFVHRPSVANQQAINQSSKQASKRKKKSLFLFTVSFPRNIGTASFVCDKYDPCVLAFESISVSFICQFYCTGCPLSLLWVMFTMFRLSGVRCTFSRSRIWYLAAGFFALFRDACIHIIPSPHPVIHVYSRTSRRM